MNRMTTLIPLALLGISSIAFGSDLDEVTTMGLSDHEVSAEYGVQSRSQRDQSRSSTSGKTQTRAQRSNGQGRTGTQETRTNGTVTQTRNTATQRNRGQAHHDGRGGNFVDVEKRGERTRSSVTTTNGDKTATRTSGSQDQQLRGNGQRNGKNLHVNRTKTDERVATDMRNNQTGESFRVVDRRTGDKVRGETPNNVRSGRSGNTGRQVTGTGTPRPGTGPNVHQGRNTTRQPASGAARAGTTSTRPGTSSRPGTATPGSVRPGTSSRPGGTVRPGSAGDSRTTVVHGRGHAPRTTVVHTGGRRHHTHYTHVRPYHGVFVYGPRPTTHTHYHGGGGGGVNVKNRDLPSRDLDREGSLAVGIKAGSLMSGYFDGPAYSDVGLGVAGRYRPAEAVGLELGLQHHSQTFTSETERSQTQVNGSVELFAFPWTRVSPYLIGGVTYNARNIQDEIWQGDALSVVEQHDSLWGLHGGVGLELALGQSLAIDLEGKYIGYLDREPTDASLPGALQLNAGLMVHF